MLLTPAQIDRLVEDLDFILPRTACNTIPLTKSRILREIESDPDVLLDLVEGMNPSDARCLGVPHEKLRSLISMRTRGVAQ
ncbi:MAG: hypothetical protein ACKOAS_05115, partial [Verrucomicrobiota bacterium]